MEFLNNLFNYEDNIVISGLTDELNVFYVSSKFQKNNKNLILLTSNMYDANKLYDKLKTYLNDVYIFPMDDFITSVALATSPEFKVKRLEVLDKTKENKNSIVVTSLMGYLRFLPSQNNNALKKKIKVNDEISRSFLIELLDNYGYTRDSLVSKTGDYSLRGFIVDIFLIENEHPIRIEFFDNKIESIRYFDEDSQLSIQNISEITIKPYNEIITEEKSSLYDWMDNPIVVYHNYSQIKAVNLKLEEEITEYNEKNTSNERYMFELSQINPKENVYLNDFDDIPLSNYQNYRYKVQKMDNFNMNLENLKMFVNKNIKNKKTVVFCLSKKKEIIEISELFDNKVVKNTIKDGEINIIEKEINEGFIVDKYVVISEYDIDKSINKKIKYFNSYRFGRKIKGFDEIKPGDYVVHSLHGIGIYSGVVTLEKNGLKKDYIQLLYKDNDKVYIPVEKIDSLFKYSVKEGTKPVINKLGTTAWAKTKASVRSKINNMTAELLELYAKRENSVGPVFAKKEEVALFESGFPYAETSDQLKAIDDILNDLSIKKPMDRLLCGDVGFGKTEVAFRAMFDTVINGYQVAYLCPTTILSRQQYQNSIERFKDFPINIALLNRFTTTKEKKEILKGISEGFIDIVIGTHRLLSNDISFKNVGLLVVDEEQRFGVSHKEKIKQIKNNVNVLTLSATPIPRTLKFALAGLRDLSVIDTPPINRYPIQTYVISENGLLVKDAIYKELSREGQTYILYNNISKIETKQKEIEKLVPEARVRIAHGQMSKAELEDVMASFLNKEFDVLLCTTIIETGIDISNVNTLIIYDANLFGLSQLYQIRGRVGRSDRVAYAYLMYDETKILSEIATKRLQAIKEFTELGSGYKIAMRDLSLRGAGDLLGSEQAGFVDAVGIDMYLKMIEETINNTEEELDTDNNIVEVETHISDSYVSDESIKIEIHQKINEIEDYASLQKIKAELEDRFGLIDEKMSIYMHEEWFEKLAKRFELKKVEQNTRYIELEFSKEISSHIKGDKLLLVATNLTPNFRLSYFHNCVRIRLYFNGLKKHFIYYLVSLLNKM